MSKYDCSDLKEYGGYSVKVSVDVTKIVKYACCAAVLIVGIIFGTRCFHKMMENDFFELD